MNHLHGMNNATVQKSQSYNGTEESYIKMRDRITSSLYFKGTHALNDERRKSMGLQRNCPYPSMANFIRKTYHILEHCDPEIIAWSEHGDTFIIKDARKLASTILPLYFKHKNFTSFTRQLSFYGFRKFRVTPVLNADYDLSTAVGHVHFYHEHFQRGNVEALIHIKRRPSTNAQTMPSRNEVKLIREDIKGLNQALVGMQNGFDSKVKDVYADLISKLKDLHQTINQTQHLNR